MAVAFLYSDKLKEYDFGPGHPFRGDRYDDFPRFLKERVPPDDKYVFLEAAPATDSDLELICDPDYIRFTRDYYRAANTGRADDSDFFSYHTMDNHPAGRPGKLEEAARLVVGQAKLAVDLVQAGKHQKAISLGGGLHHAKRRSGEGFCLYNDVAFAGVYLTERHHLERVVILDTDAHAGNGTAEYFYSDPRVLLIDIHQDPRTIYPGTGFVNQIGEGEGKGKTVNVPLPPGAGDESYRAVFEELVGPLIAEFRPEIIVRNGGSDPHFKDDLTSLGLTVEGFRMIGEKVRQMARECGGKQIDLIASGYNRDVLSYAWLALEAGIAGWDVPVAEPVAIPAPLREDRQLTATRFVIQEVKRHLAGYWSGL